MTVPLSKAELRRRFRKEPPSPEALSEPERAVLDWPPYREANTVFIYRSMPGEASTAVLLEDALRSGKQVIIPDQSANAAIPSPDGIDLAVVPGMAFDERGYRLGRGGGFYDRFLAGFTGVSVGLASRLLETVPVEAHDRNVNHVAFGNTIIESRAR
jgi:5-formyltetrahydrofolate cyclo-ligase